MVFIDNNCSSTFDISGSNHPLVAGVVGDPTKQNLCEPKLRIIKVLESTYESFD